MAEMPFTTQRLDPLGIVAGICQEIDLIAQIDHAVGDTARKVRVGQAVQVMVINALGFISRPLNGYTLCIMHKAFLLDAFRHDLALGYAGTS